jgi:TRAP-type C4-dicarboxylate transport system permease small subunit
VAINLLSPETMGAIVLAGLNLATVYGMALIVLALVQALIYNVMCRRKEDELQREEASTGDAAGSGPGTRPGTTAEPDDRARDTTAKG